VIRREFRFILLSVWNSANPADIYYLYLHTRASRALPRKHAHLQNRRVHARRWQVDSLDFSRWIGPRLEREGKIRLRRRRVRSALTVSAGRNARGPARPEYGPESGWPRPPCASHGPGPRAQLSSAAGNCPSTTSRPRKTSLTLNPVGPSSNPLRASSSSSSSLAASHETCSKHPRQLTGIYRASSTFPLTPSLYGISFNRSGSGDVQTPRDNYHKILIIQQDIKFAFVLFDERKIERHTTFYIFLKIINIDSDKHFYEHLA